MRSAPGSIITDRTGGGVLYVIASGAAGFDLAGSFASNGFGEQSPGGYGLSSALVPEPALLFWIAPILGAALAGFTYRWLGSEEE